MPVGRLIFDQVPRRHNAKKIVTEIKGLGKTRFTQA